MTGGKICTISVCCTIIVQIFIGQRVNVTNKTFALEVIKERTAFACAVAMLLSLRSIALLGTSCFAFDVWYWLVWESFEQTTAMSSCRWTEAAVSFWSVQSPSQDEIGRVWRETNVLKIAICFCIDLHCSNSAAHSMQQASNPTCCECRGISRHIPPCVCSLCSSSGVSAVEVPKCLVLCLCQRLVLFEKLPVYFAADVEYGICRCRLETIACSLVGHCLLKVFQCCALRLSE